MYKMQLIVVTVPLVLPEISANVDKTKVKAYLPVYKRHEGNWK